MTIASLEAIRVTVGALVDELEETEEWIARDPSPLLVEARRVWSLCEAAVHSQFNEPVHRQDLVSLTTAYGQLRSLQRLVTK